MRELIIGKNDAGQRLDKFITKTLDLPTSLLYKSIRLKKIKVNRKRAEISTVLSEGDTIQCFLAEEFFARLDGECDERAISLAKIKPCLDIVYEDENILLVDKRPGLAVHPHDGAEYGRTLIDHIQAYLYQKREWSPRGENSFTPALCNRIDRNTGGIVIAAKTAEALRVMNQKIKDRELDKRYLAIVEGKLKHTEGTLKGYLFKDAKKNRVFVTDTPQAGAKSCQTNYRVLASRDGLSLVECELITGRTHQIRAQFAHAGHPLLGDGKYGKLDKRFDRNYQALYSYKLTFTFESDAGSLNALNGRSFRVENVDFVEEYFPGVTI